MQGVGCSRSHPRRGRVGLLSGAGTLTQFSRCGYRFEVTDSGPRGGRPVVLLHGFPQDRRCWELVSPRLNAAGYRTLAPDQRGYSPGAAPSSRAEYRIRLLADDVLALADSAGAARFDLVGHDWGAAVAWYLAVRHPQRVRSLAALSVTHPGAFAEAMLGGAQALHSWYMLFFRLPLLPGRLLGASEGILLERALLSSGLGAEAARRYARRARTPAGLEGPLNWYRALSIGGMRRVPPASCPVLYVWSDGDRFVTRAAARRCGRHVSGPYRFEVITGCSHWIPEEAGDQVSGLLLEHLEAAGRDPR